MLHLSETRQFLQSSSFWEARRALIGQLSSALWLAEYLKRVMEMLRPLPYCDTVSRCDETKTIKPIINEAFVASSGDIITDYNDLYCLFTLHVASHRVNIPMSAFVIGEMTKNKHYSTLLKTRIWIVSGKFFKYVLVVSSFGSPNKVLSLSQQNTASPGHGAGGSNNTTARIKIKPSLFAYTFGRCYANLPTQWRRHVGACLNELF